MDDVAYAASRQVAELATRVLHNLCKTMARTPANGEDAAEGEAKGRRGVIGARAEARVSVCAVIDARFNSSFCHVWLGPETSLRRHSCGRRP